VAHNCLFLHNIYLIGHEFLSVLAHVRNALQLVLIGAVIWSSHNGGDPGIPPVP